MKNQQNSSFTRYSYLFKTPIVMFNRFVDGEVGYKSKKYPVLLKKIGGRPKKLYYRGIWGGEIFENCLAVVGSRKMTSYGKSVTERLVYDIAGAGVTIVSGFMYGVDATAHRAALDAGGKTIAVLGGGVDYVYPTNQVSLYKSIVERGGLIISEFSGEISPGIGAFPRRNRIVAGLSKAVLVVEAELNSGSLITARLAVKYGRKLFAVPGPITSATSKGTLDLMKKGVFPVTEPSDILDFYGISHLETKSEISEVLKSVS
jgi:DNA processing protein